MLLDLLAQDNFINVNINLIKSLGLNTAIYVAELLNIYRKAVTKNKLVDDMYIKVSRDYITDKTSLLNEEQLICDANLMKINAVKKCPTDPDLLVLDVQLILSLIASDDIKLIEDIRKRVTVKNPRGVKESKRQQRINALKNSIVCSNYELLTALRDWVDSIFSNPTGYLSEPAIKLFQDTLNNYTQGDLDLALRIVHIATAQSYKDCQWAINVYEKDKVIINRQQQQKLTALRVTDQIKADKLSDEIF